MLVYMCRSVELAKVYNKWLMLAGGRENNNIQEKKKKNYQIFQ